VSRLRKMKYFSSGQGYLPPSLSRGGRELWDPRTQIKGKSGKTCLKDGRMRESRQDLKKVKKAIRMSGAEVRGHRRQTDLCVDREGHCCGRIPWPGVTVRRYHTVERGSFLSRL